jgi:hypothetical protein
VTARPNRPSGGVSSPHCNGHIQAKCPTRGRRVPDHVMDVGRSLRRRHVAAAPIGTLRRRERHPLGSPRRTHHRILWDTIPLAFSRDRRTLSLCPPTPLATFPPDSAGAITRFCETNPFFGFLPPDSPRAKPITPHGSPTQSQSALTPSPFSCPAAAGLEMRVRIPHRAP